MPFTLHVLPAQRLALVRFSGHVQGPDLIEAGLQAIHDADWAPGFTELWDAREAPVLDLDLEAIRQLARLEHLYRDQVGAGTFVFLTRRSYAVAFLRLFLHLLPASTRRYHVCVSEEEVLRILHLDAWPRPADAAPSADRPPQQAVDMYERVDGALAGCHWAERPLE